MQSYKNFKSDWRLLPVTSLFFCTFSLLVFLFSSTSAQAGTQQKNLAPLLPESTRQSQPEVQQAIKWQTEACKVDITYPLLGNAVADTELTIWVREQAATFTEAVDRIPVSLPTPCELTISYESRWATSKLLSVVFYISTAMGGVTPEAGLATFVYDISTGRRLSYGDIFMHPEALPQRLSTLCKESLLNQLGPLAKRDMIEAGTAPDWANFDLFALEPDRLIIHFPPYQAAPYEAGYLTVTIPFDQLKEFKPTL